MINTSQYIKVWDLDMIIMVIVDLIVYMGAFKTTFL